MYNYVHAELFDLQLFIIKSKDLASPISVVLHTIHTLSYYIRH